MQDVMDFTGGLVGTRDRSRGANVHADGLLTSPEDRPDESAVRNRLQKISSVSTRVPFHASTPLFKRLRSASSAIVFPPWPSHDGCITREKRGERRVEASNKRGLPPGGSRATLIREMNALEVPRAQQPRQLQRIAFVRLVEGCPTKIRSSQVRSGKACWRIAGAGEIPA
jgi:hypothetical protein